MFSIPGGNGILNRGMAAGAASGRAKHHVIDEATLNVLHLKMNYMNDPVLREPRFVAVLGRVQGN